MLTSNYRSLRNHVITLALLLALFAPSAAQALPQLPSSFYGSVTSNGARVPDGTVVSAWIDDVKYAEAAVFTDSNQSVYLIDVPGDDPETTGVVEGGHENDTITFKVNNVLIAQTAQWHGGTNVPLNLTVPQNTPVLTSISPASGMPGAQVNLTIVGANTHFASGVTQADLGAGITVNSVSVVNATQLAVSIAIAADAAAGPRPVTIVTGAEQVSLANGFTVVSDAIIVVVGGVTSGAQGTDVTVPITVETDVTGQNILSFDFEISYDPSVIEAANFATASTMSQGFSASAQLVAPGRYRVAAYRLTPLAGFGTLITLQFQVKGAAGQATAIHVDSFRFNSGVPVALTRDGFVIVQSLEVSGRISLARDANMPVPGVDLALTPAGGNSTSNASGAFSVASRTVDNQILTPSKARYRGGALSTLDASIVLQCVVGRRPLSACPQEVVDVDDDGETTAFDAVLIARYVVRGLTDLGSLVGNWSFSPKNYVYSLLSSSQPNQNFAAILVGDVSNSWTSTMARDVSSENTPPCVTLSQFDEANGGMAILIDELPGAEVYAYEAEFAYDADLFEFVDVVMEGTASENWLYDVFAAPEQGIVRMGAFSADPLPAVPTGTPLVIAQFQPFGGGAADHAPLLTGFRFNEGEPAVSVCASPQEATKIFLPAIQGQ